MFDISIKTKYRAYIIFIVVIILLFLIHLEIFKLEKYDPPHFVIPFLIEHTDKYSPRIISDVPLNIYESWHANNVPEKMKETIYKLCEMNPEFDYYLYDDEACLKFIKENFDQDVVDAFILLKPGAYKSDLWRYCILYKKGGLYLDIKYYSTEPLINIIEENPIIFVKDTDKACEKKVGIYNAFMASPPNNITFKLCIDDIVTSCKNRSYKMNSLDITGPCLLGEILEKQYTRSYFNSIKFTFVDKRGIVYNNRVIFKIYNEYRKDQSYFQITKHYSEMWSNKDVYGNL
jgi:mannosyltransferase OCH1-like enzyme